MKVFIQAQRLSCIQAGRLGPTCAHAQCFLLWPVGVCSRLELCGRGRGPPVSCSPFFLPFSQCLASAANLTFAFFSDPSFVLYLSFRGLYVWGIGVDKERLRNGNSTGVRGRFLGTEFMHFCKHLIFILFEQALSQCRTKWVEMQKSKERNVKVGR